jgi:catechol 2,3-dioxygenase-like lactoylglutathione lyase family enzyme
MSRYVDSTEQLVTEIMVRDIKRSTEFYCRLGFALLRDGGDFVELTWEEHQLFLDERSDSHEGDQATLYAPLQFPPANIRVMVPNVDDYWRLAQDLSARIVAPIADRSYGLRDFTIADPDGFGVRFASILKAPEQSRGT